VPTATVPPIVLSDLPSAAYMAESLAFILGIRFIPGLIRGWLRRRQLRRRREVRALRTMVRCMGWARADRCRGAGI